MAPKRVAPRRFVAEHGVVLASGKGPVPSLAEAIAGEPIRGSWWGHAAGKRIFDALNEVDDDPDVLCFRLVDGKNTFVHRRLWPALARLAGELGHERTTAIRQEHTETGAHRNVLTPYPEWVPPDVARAARELDIERARAALGAWAASLPPRRKGPARGAAARTRSASGAAARKARSRAG